MKKWTYNIAFKTLCVLLAVIGLSGVVLSGSCIALLLTVGGYEKSYDELYAERIKAEYDWIPRQMAFLCQDYGKDEEALLEEIQYYRNEYGIDLVIRGDDGEVIYSDTLKDQYAATFSQRISVGGNWYPVSETDGERAQGEYTVYRATYYSVTVCVFDPFVNNNTQIRLWVLNLAYRMRLLVIPVFPVCMILLVAAVVFLCCAAGRRGKGEAVVENFFDRIYLEVYLLLAIGLFVAESWFVYAFRALWLILLGAILFLFLDSLLLILFLLTLSTRIKSGNFYQRTATYHLLRAARKWMECAALVPKIVIGLCGIAVFDLFLATVLDFTEFLAALLIEGLVMMGILVWYGAAIQRLNRDQKQLSSGNMEHRCDPTGMPPGLRSFGEEWNRSAEGMERAVEEKMKSERFKTELITNVSHDIKTPLTSIVNYVDLMKKETIENERILEYLEVLDRQSARLKKLAEDLVESSKAASGVLPVDFAPVDLKVLLEQALAEYAPKLEEKGLQLCTSVTENPVFISADGRHLWRVLDNLMNNVCKYALSGTRVYCSVEGDETSASMVFRNISAQSLSLSGVDLAERFVRGDSSRNTEGSGLGLAIARSLVELQKGKMEIFVDGDLFRVTLTFDRIL